MHLFFVSEEVCFKQAVKTKFFYSKKRDNLDDPLLLVIFSDTLNPKSVTYYLNGPYVLKMLTLLMRMSFREAAEKN